MNMTRASYPLTVPYLPTWDLESHYFSGVELLCFGSAAPPDRCSLVSWDQAIS